MYSAVDQRGTFVRESVGWRPYAAGDIGQIKARSADDFERDAFEEYGEAWTLWEEGRPVGIFGIAPVDEGVGMFWGVVSDDARGRGLRWVKRRMRFVQGWLMVQMGVYRRLQTTIRLDREYKRFIELLGFQKEGLMRKIAADGGDLWLYSRVD